MDKIDWMIIFSIILLVVFIAWVSSWEPDSITGEVVLNFSNNILTGQAVVPLEKEYNGLVKKYDDLSEPQWDHMPLSYRFVDGDANSSGFCSGEKRDKIRRAFEMIRKKSEGEVFFVETNFDADIDVLCSEINFSEFVVAEGEANYDFVGYEITSGVLNFYDVVDWNRDSECLDLELHEILHVLGFGHDEDERSIMYFKNNGICKNKVDENIVSELMRIY